MNKNWIIALALLLLCGTSAPAQNPAKPNEPLPAGYEQLRRYLFPPQPAPNVKGAKALYNATIDLWAENGLYFINFNTGSLDYGKQREWREKWKKRADEIADDKDFTAADLLAQMAVDELGRFNYYLPPPAVAEENRHSDPTVVGIGTKIDYENETAAENPVVDDKHPVTFMPFPGSPAEKGGMKAGDVLKKIDGQDVNGKTLEEVMKLIKGKEGSQVKIDVERNKENVTLTITRERFTFPVVHITKLEDDIVVIKYDNFSAQNGLAEMRAALLDVRKMKLEQKRPVKVILDLRGNPGGLLHFAVQIASYMIPEGTITTIKERAGDTIVTQRWSVTRDTLLYTYPATVKRSLVGYEATPHELILPEDVPLVCLINGRSYSASELMAGALQANRRAIVVGTPSGGKGEGQQVFELPENRRGKVIKFFFAPGDREIDWAGVHPDEGWQVEWKKPEKKGDDNQLEAAKKALKQEYERIEAQKARYHRIMDDGTKERKADWDKQRNEQRKELEEALQQHRKK